MDGTIRVRSVAWGATALVLAVLCTVLMTQAWSVGAAPGDDDSTFVPTAGCRLADTRPAPNTVGPRSTPIGADSSLTVAVHGSNGRCTGSLAIPNDAVAVALNVTAVNATAASDIRLFPANLTRVPTLSNLNVQAGAPATPNKVDVKLSPDGKIKVYNFAGSVNVVLDVVGYYTNSTLEELAAGLGAANARISALDSRVSALESGAGALQTQVAGLDSSQPFAVTAFNGSSVALSTTGTSVLDLSVTASVAGQVTLNYSGYVFITGSSSLNATCAPFRSTEVPTAIGFDQAGVSIVSLFGGSTGAESSISGTRSFDIAAGETVVYSLACDLNLNATIGNVWGRTMTAVFTPAS